MAWANIPGSAYEADMQRRKMDLAAREQASNEDFGRQRLEIARQQAADSKDYNRQNLDISRQRMKNADDYNKQILEMNQRNSDRNYQMNKKESDIKNEAVLHKMDWENALNQQKYQAAQERMGAQYDLFSQYQQVNGRAKQIAQQKKQYGRDTVASLMKMAMLNGNIVPMDSLEMANRNLGLDGQNNGITGGYFTQNGDFYLDYSFVGPDGNVVTKPSKIGVGEQLRMMNESPGIYDAQDIETMVGRMRKMHYSDQQIEAYGGFKMSDIEPTQGAYTMRDLVMFNREGREAQKLKFDQENKLFDRALKIADFYDKRVSDLDRDWAKKISDDASLDDPNGKEYKSYLEKRTALAKLRDEAFSPFRSVQGQSASGNGYDKENRTLTIGGKTYKAGDVITNSDDGKEYVFDGEKMVPKPTESAFDENARKHGAVETGSSTGEGQSQKPYTPVGKDSDFFVLKTLEDAGYDRDKEGTSSNVFKQESRTPNVGEESGSANSEQEGFDSPSLRRMRDVLSGKVEDEKNERDLNKTLEELSSYEPSGDEDISEDELSHAQKVLDGDTYSDSERDEALRSFEKKNAYEVGKRDSQSDRKHEIENAEKQGKEQARDVMGMSPSDFDIKRGYDFLKKNNLSLKKDKGFKEIVSFIDNFKKSSGNKKPVDYDKVFMVLGKLNELGYDPQKEDLNEYLDKFNISSKHYGGGFKDYEGNQKLLEDLETSRANNAVDFVNRWKKQQREKLLESRNKKDTVSERKERSEDTRMSGALDFVNKWKKGTNREKVNYDEHFEILNKLKKMGYDPKKEDLNEYIENLEETGFVPSDFSLDPKNIDRILKSMSVSQINKIIDFSNNWKKQRR